ncbi:MAG: Imm49 family immunity protein [Planctomycetota bacterium]
MNFEDAGSALSSTTAFWATALFNPEVPVEELGAVALQTSANLRTLALFTLLARGDDEHARSNLSRSAGAWCRFLSRASRSEAGRIPHFVSGRVDPLIDALAAGDFELVERIGALAPAERQGRAEYEDDHCYARLVVELTRDEVDSARVEALMERLEAEQPDDGLGRSAFCRAIAERSSDDLEEALDARLAAFEEGRRDAREAGQEETAEVVAAQSVCVEGLAWLRLADRRGVEVSRAFRFCPEEMLRPHGGAFPRDFDA